MDHNRTWFLTGGGRKGAAREVEDVIATGPLPAGSADVRAGWLTLGLAFDGERVTPLLEGQPLARVTDGRYHLTTRRDGHRDRNSWVD